MQPWDAIRASGRRAEPPKYGEQILLPAVGLPSEGKETHWLVGSYSAQTGLTRQLRSNPDAQAWVEGLHLRFGFRETDVPPTGTRQERFGATVVGDNPQTDFSSRRGSSSPPPVKAGPAAIHRQGDVRKNVLTYWQSQTPQSHHIVEFNHLRDIGASTYGSGPLDHDQLPCVLLMAEFHQRYISSVLRLDRGLPASKLREKLPETYRSIYCDRSAALKPLWGVARAILEAAGLRVP